MPTASTKSLLTTILILVVTTPVSLVLILFSFVATQGMSGRESVFFLITFFAPFFAVAVALPATAVAIFRSRERALRTAAAYAGGGAIGGVFMALSMYALIAYDQELRVFTHGGPTGQLLLLALPASAICGLICGAVLQRISGR
jgi:uncharacterized membrane protein YhaH (DUF805 family)